MDTLHRMCDLCNHPVLAVKYNDHIKSKAHYENRMKLRVNIEVPRGVTKEVLQDELKKYGRVHSCSFDPATNTAVVEFKERAAADALRRNPLNLLNSRGHQREVPAEFGVDDKAMIAVIKNMFRLGHTDIEKHIAKVIEHIKIQDQKRDYKVALIIKDLEEHLSEILPECQAVVFGSTVMGLALKGGAVDISICNRQAIPGRQMKFYLERICKVMLDLPYKYADVAERLDARDPMITFVHKFTLIPCKMVLDDACSAKTARQLFEVLSLDTRIRPLILFVKYWAERSNLIGYRKFTGYAVTLLVVFYLQQIPEAMIPAICVLHSKNIREMAKNICNKSTLSKLIEEFFSYYARIKLEHTVLSPHIGEKVDREIFLEKPETIPHYMKMYKKILLDGARPLRVDAPIVLQDPYEVNINVTSEVRKEVVADFQSRCEKARKIIKDGYLVKFLEELSKEPECHQQTKSQIDSTFSRHLETKPKINTPPPKCLQQPTSEMNTSFRAARFLHPNYLVPGPDKTVVLSKQELFDRWVNVMFVILPDFLVNFVRLHVEPYDVAAEPNDWGTRSSRSSDWRKTCRWNEAVGTEVNGGFSRRWLCRGRPVACSWQQRKRAAAELEIDPSTHPMEREIIISKHLERSSSSGKVVFYFVIRVDEEKESVRCFFENLELAQEPFTTVIRSLTALMTLWTNSAFETGFSLRCVTGTLRQLPEELGMPAASHQHATSEIHTTFPSHLQAMPETDTSHLQAMSQFHTTFPSHQKTVFQTDTAFGSGQQTLSDVYTTFLESIEQPTSEMSTSFPSHLQPMPQTYTFPSHLQATLEIDTTFPSDLQTKPESKTSIPRYLQQPTSEINTTFRAARFLHPKYLIPEPDMVLSKKELFDRWLNVMFVILPDFLKNFVRLQVEPYDVPAEPDDQKHRWKIRRLSESGDVSSWNAAGETEVHDGITRRWLCTGRPVVCSWQQRKKAATELELDPSIHPMEREVIISKHLEQSFSSKQVTFYLVIKVEEDKECIRCVFENLDVTLEPFTTMARSLISLLTLWINNAFEIGFSLRCVTGVYIPG